MKKLRCTVLRLCHHKKEKSGIAYSENRKAVGTRILMGWLVVLFCFGASQLCFGQCPTLTVVPQVVNASCGILNDGQIAVRVEGGQTPYAFQWNNGARSSVAKGLAEGDYTVIVTDAAGCTASLTQKVVALQKLQITTELTSPTTNIATDGIIEMDIKGGVVPYTIQIVDYSDVKNIKRFVSQGFRIEGLKAGRYAIEAIDARGCIQTDMVTLAEQIR